MSTCWLSASPAEPGVTTQPQVHPSCCAGLEDRPPISPHIKATTHQPHREQPWPGHDGLRRRSGLRDPCHCSELFYGGEPPSTGPTRPPCAAQWAQPEQSKRGQAAGQPCLLLLPSDTLCRMQMLGMGTRTLHEEEAEPCPCFLATRSTGEMGAVCHWDTSRWGGMWHCKDVCRDRNHFPATVLFLLHLTAAGWGHGHACSPPPCGTAPARPYRLKVGLVVLGYVAGLVDVRFIPGLGHKWAPVKPQLSSAIICL